MPSAETLGLLGEISTKGLASPVICNVSFLEDSLLSPIVKILFTDNPELFKLTYTGIVAPGFASKSLTVATAQLQSLFT
jgi:hypothetical protein